MTMRRRRGGPLRRAFPWLLAATLVGVVGFGVWRAVRGGDLVAAARALREGDPANGIKGDPLAALSVLEPLLEREPNNVPALLESARAYQDLRSWTPAIAALQHACDASTELRDKVFAKSMEMNLLAIADDYDEAVKVGEQIQALQPDDPAHKLRLGPIYLKGSYSAQELVLSRLMDRGERQARDLRVEKKVEAFVTDLWGNPDAAALVAELTPGGDVVVRQQLAEHLQAARRRFQLADEALAGFRNWPGFDPSVAKAWCQVLERSGRLFDAHVEAGMALREPNLNVSLQREFLDVKARCAIQVDDWAQAAEDEFKVMELFAADPKQPILPPTTLWLMYEARIRAQHWDWILEHIVAHVDRYGDDPVLRWAHAAALAGTGNTDAARAELREPFATVRLASRSAPPSLKLFPERRRAIAMLAYQLFTASGDGELASAALDALLAMDPEDAEALRLRRDLQLGQGRLEAAAADAFSLLMAERRDRADFDAWLDAADRFAQQRTGRELVQQAAARVKASQGVRRTADEALFEAYKTLGLKAPQRSLMASPDVLYVPSDPALTFRVVEVLIEEGDIEQARTELRKLSDDFPMVQEFRFRLGKLLVREGQFAYAAQEFRELLDAVPDDTEALDMAIRTELAQGQPEAAAALVTRTILADPLGAGAVRYGQRLLDRGRSEQAQKLVERIVRWTDLDTRLDVLVLSARANLAMGRLDDAQAILGSLATAYPDSFDVALLGLDVGLALGAEGLVQGSIAALAPLAPELFPDQLHDLAGRLLAAGLDLELVKIFDDAVCEIPAARLSLRDVAEAHKRLGDPTRADELLGRLPEDPDALVDRFLLLCLQGDPDEAARRLRLQPTSDRVLRARGDLCLLASNALMQLQAMLDGTPLTQLTELHADESLPPSRLELLDALLRLMPNLQRLDDILPSGVVQDPRGTYPHAGPDVEAIVALARSDREQARRVCEDLLYLILMQDRSFWADESRQLAQHALGLLPGLAAPTRTLARAELADIEPCEAMHRIQPLLAGTAEPEDLRLLLEAARECDHSEWGVALALQFEEQPDALLVLADVLAEWGHPEEAHHLYEKVLAALPDDADAQAGLITTLVALRRNEEAVTTAEQALTDHPTDAHLAEVCGDALAGIFKPSAKALSLMQYLWSRHEDLDQVGEALARAAGSDTAGLSAVLEVLVDRASHRAPETDPERAALRAQALVRAARTARAHDLPDLARQLNEMALRTEPGAITLYRELGFLELEAGALEEARSYLEVLSFVDTEDRDAAMALAQLDFRQLGQPQRAADVVRRTFSGTIPPDMVEILAAEAWLLGRPQDAITEFYKVSKSPLISPDTYLTVTRIAYAAGLDEVARFTGDLMLANTPADDPRRPRVQWLLDRRLPKAAPAKPTASG